MRYESHDLDGRGAKRTRVYDLKSLHPLDFWVSVTDVPCPHPGCKGKLRHAEAGYVPGYRICDACGRHFMASGSATRPEVLRVGRRRSITMGNAPLRRR
jgi:hypothetical protein